MLGVVELMFRLRQGTCPIRTRLSCSFAGALDFRPDSFDKRNDRAKVAVACA